MGAELLDPQRELRAIYLFALSGMRRFAQCAKRPMWRSVRQTLARLIPERGCQARKRLLETQLGSVLAASMSMELWLL